MIDAADMLLIDQIVDRAASMAEVNKLTLLIDLHVVHEVHQLRLKDLLAADSANFAHDVFGISAKLNRDTGQLEDFFTPRFATR